MDLTQKPFYLRNDQIDHLKGLLARMTTHEKAGQVFCVLGDVYPAETLNLMVKEYGIGGILFRPDTIDNINAKYEGLDILCRIPLLKAANLEEGGCGAILEGTRFASQMQIAATNQTTWAAMLGKISAQEGRTVQINWTFSPVVDIDMNYLNPITNVRTFGRDVEVVKRMCLATMEAIQSYPMAACAKHFPGDGVDYRDHHLHPTYNSLSADEWYASYGEIYQAMIDKGLMTIMAGHILQPNVSKDVNPSLTNEECLPASLSKELLQGVLRNKYGFNGIITSDATIMGGFTQVMSRSKAIPSTIANGCDVILFNTCFKEDFDYLLAGIESGLLTMERLDEAVLRILALKSKLGLFESIPLETKKEVLDIAELQTQCARQAITLVKDIDHCLPLNKDTSPDVRVIMLGDDHCPDGSIKEIAANILKSRGFTTSFFNIEKEELNGSSNLAKNRVTLYLANCEPKSDQTTVRLFWNSKFALDIPRYIHEEKSVFISFSNPYHLQDVPRIRTYINAYTATRATIEASLLKLVGEQAFIGLSPIDAFCGLPDTKF